MPSISISRKEIESIEWLIQHAESTIAAMPNGTQKRLKQRDLNDCKANMRRFKIKYDGGMLTDIKKYQRRLEEQKKNADA